MLSGGVNAADVNKALFKINRYWRPLLPLQSNLIGLLIALVGVSSVAATYRCNNGKRAPDGSDLWKRPFFHFWPTTIESQDISGPIQIGDTCPFPRHVFIDNVPVGCPALVQPVQAKPLEWGHFSSRDLVHWTEHKEAPTEAFDGSIVDTGAVFQHPNGTVLALYATSNVTSNLPVCVCLVNALSGRLLIRCLVALPGC